MVSQKTNKYSTFSSIVEFFYRRSNNKRYRLSICSAVIAISSVFMFYKVAVATPIITPEALPNLLLSTAADPFAFSQVGEVVTFQYVVTNRGTSIIGPTQITISDEKIESGAAFNCGDSDSVLGVSMSITCNHEYVISSSDLIEPLILTRAIARSATLESNIATVTLINVIGSTSSTTSSPPTSVVTTTTLPSRLIDIGSVPEVELTSVAPFITRPPIKVQLIEDLPATGSNTNLVVATIFALVILGSLLLNLSNYRNAGHHSNDRTRSQFSNQSKNQQKDGEK
jgi:hypothetical protein